MDACFCFSLVYCIVRDSCEMVRDCIAIQWVSTAVQFKCSHLYPIELATRNDSRPPQTNRPRYFGPAADSEQPATSGIRSSDTPIMVEDEDESKDIFNPESYYSGASSAKTTEKVRAFIDSTFSCSIPKHKCQEIAGNTLNQTCLQQKCKKPTQISGSTKRRVFYE